MIYLILALLVAVAVVAYLLGRSASAKQNRGAAPQSDHFEAPREAAKAAKTAPPTLPAPASAKAHQPGLVRTANTHILALLDDFEWAHSASLSRAEARQIVDVLQQIPRPPSALYKLVSPEFLAHASTLELGDMVMAEPEIAAKVLAIVNAPLYGLKSPLGSVGQAVTFLGMTTVRSICLKYMLNESFQSKDPDIRAVYERLWNASTLASELCSKLAQGLQLPDSGVLVTQVVLSFLGHVASHSLLDKETLGPMMKKGMLERARVEQDELGLCAAEIGSLLMREWELPEAIVERVRAIDLTLVTPFDPGQTERIGAALCYICARLGERLAYGEIQDLASVDLYADRSMEFFQVQSYLQQAPLSRLNDLLHTPSLVSTINNMVLTMKVRK